jgi:peptidyl-prolyl cis-trans isomerase D
MSVIQNIRDKYAVLVIALIALSLVGFVMMDAFVNNGRGSMFSNTTTVGKVNGKSISRNDFEKKISNTQQMYGQGADREQLIGMVWNQEVDQLVMEEEYNKTGLSFTAKELNDQLFGKNPPDWMKQQFGDPAKGEPFRINEAKQYFANVKKQKNNPQIDLFYEAYIQQPIINNTLRQKYMSLLSQSVYVPKWIAEKQIADNNIVANISYVNIPYSSINDSTIKVSDADVQAYVNKHKSEFKQEEETRGITYVSFNASATGADSAIAKQQVLDLQSEFQTTTDVQAFIGRVGSELAYNDGYTLASLISVPYADSIKRLADGQMFGPYVDGKNYAFAKMIGRRLMPDSVKCRHILIKTGDKGQPTIADSIGKKRIDSIEAALKSGADFNTMVLQYTDDAGSKDKKGEYDFTSIQFSNLSKEFAEVIFYGKSGDKKVVKVENSSYSGYHYIEVLEQKKIETALKIAYLAKPILPSQETINTATTAAQQFAANSKDKKQFDDNVAKENMQILSASDIKENDFSINGLGSSRSLVRWVYEKELGDISEPTELDEKIIVAIISEVNPKGTMPVSKAKPLTEIYIRNEKKAQQIINNVKATGLEEIANANNTTVMKADSISFVMPFIPNIGNEIKIAGAAFNKNLLNKTSTAIAGNTGVFFVKVEKIDAKPSDGNTPEMLRLNLENQQKNTLGYRSVEALKKSATIKDYRFTFY